MSKERTEDLVLSAMGSLAFRLNESVPQTFGFEDFLRVVGIAGGIWLLIHFKNKYSGYSGLEHHLNQQSEEAETGVSSATHDIRELPRYLRLEAKHGTDRMIRENTSYMEDRISPESIAREVKRNPGIKEAVLRVAGRIGKKYEILSETFETGDARQITDAMTSGAFDLQNDLHELDDIIVTKKVPFYLRRNKA